MSRKRGKREKKKLNNSPPRPFERLPFEKAVPKRLRGLNTAFDLNLLFRVPDPCDDALREIAEFFAEQIQSADMLGVRMNADAQGDVVLLIQMEVGQLDRGKRRAVERTAVFVDAPSLEQAVLRGRVAPPGWIEPPAPPADTPDDTTIYTPAGQTNAEPAAPESGCVSSGGISPPDPALPGGEEAVDAPFSEEDPLD